MRKVSMFRRRPAKSMGRFSWRNISIGRKYLFTFSLAAVLFLVAGIIVYSQLSLVENNIEKIDQESIHVIDMGQLGSLVQQKDVQIADFIITKDQAYLAAFQELQQEFDAMMEKVTPLFQTQGQKRILSDIQVYDLTINQLFLNDITSAIETEQDIVANSLRAQSASLRDTNVALVSQLIEDVNAEQSNSVQQAKERIDSSVIFLILTNVIVILFGIIISVIVSRLISNHLKRVVQITTEMANGNLAGQPMDYEGKDEIGQLASAINQMKNNIRGILLKVTDASESVTSQSEELTQSAHEVSEGSEQIASTMETLSVGSETQATSVSGLSESMNEFTKSVQISEEDGAEIASTSQHVLHLTTEGTTLMKESVKQMNRIDSIVADAVNQVQGLDKQSDQISKLVLVVKDIADQTNLLSLNAAIEAARAGEHGKGFAVVADEVRKLAEQVSLSVSEITGIVETIQADTDHVVGSLNKGYEEVKEGTEQIEKTGRNFESIDTSVSDIVHKILAISNNLKNIAENSHHMNGLIQDIAAVSEESAAGVEQAAAMTAETSSSMDEVTHSAEVLATLAEQLDDEIGVFTLN